MTDCDVVIVGAGMAGASIAAELATKYSILLLEAEDQPGYHSTGRSAAFWTESYGGPHVQPLTSASGPFLRDPPANFSEKGFLHQRGVLTIAEAGQEALLGRMLTDFANSNVEMHRWEREQLVSALPELGEQWTNALHEPSCCDIDVAALHAAYLKQARQRGVITALRSELISASFSSGKWEVETTNGPASASIVINAAGAWADTVARRCGIGKLNITPKRRTMLQVRTNLPSRGDMPLVIAADESFYVKPEGDGRWWLSPQDESDDVARDVVPEELDVAIAVDRFEKAFRLNVEAVEQNWAGLRSFAPDRLPVIGRDAGCPEFFWFAGQGGWGIQTAPAAAALGAAILTEDFSNPMLEHIDASRYAATRFTT